MSKAKAIIARNELDDDHILWINACEKLTHLIEYRVVNLVKDSWLEEIKKAPFDVILTKPGGLTEHFRQLYVERSYILENVIGYKLYPSINEILIYENKRYLSFWLKAMELPHPATHVFYNQRNAEEYTNKATLPIVGKSNIGASGSGVSIIELRNEAYKYIDQTMNGRGAPQRSGPNLQKGKLLKRGLHYLKTPSDIKNKLKLYKTRSNNKQRNFVIFQEYIKHDFEWRAIRIGDSFFAHKKLKNKEKSSGSLLKGYENPPLELLNFVKEITDKYKFYSQAVDIFESERGYLINEMQCIFGQSDPYQMLVDGKPGRYLYRNNEWVFEEGDFASNQCYDLRMQYVLQILV